MTAEPIVTRRFLGNVEVDSGTLIVGDPMYVLPETARGKAGVDYQAVIDAPDEVVSALGGQPVMLLGRFGGDGSYPVFAEFDDDGVMVRLTVEFVEPDDGEEDEA